MNMENSELKLSVNLEDLDNSKKEKWTKLLMVQNDLYKKAIKSIKPEVCPLCKCKISSLCKSHSLPSFVLKNIAENGFVQTIWKIVKLNPKKEQCGVKDAGVFFYICRDCDSKYFQDYENPDNLTSKFSQLIMAEIAMKNSLFYSTKREVERASKALYEEASLPFIFDEHLMNIDIDEYKQDIDYDKRHVEKKDNKGYRLGFYQILPYVTPIACQVSVAITLDLKNRLINDNYYPDKSYRIENCIICVYPLKTTTVVALFSRDRTKRYRGFYKQLKALDLAEALEKINYIVFKYSEDFFLSRSLGDDILKKLTLVAEDSNMAVGPVIPSKMDFYKAHFGLSNSRVIPNILLEEYAINR